MIILDPVYSQALVQLGLDPQTYPVLDTSHDDGWGSNLNFNSTLAQLPVGLWSSWSAVTNVGVKIGSTTTSMTNSVVDASSTKGTKTVVTDQTPSLRVQGGPSSTKVVANTGNMSLQTTRYSTSVTSDTSTGLEVNTASHQTSVQSSASTQLSTSVKQTKVATQVPSHILSSQVKEYTVAVAE